MSIDENTTMEDHAVAVAEDGANAMAAAADAESNSLLEDLGAEGGQSANLDMLLDVSLKITVELGRAQLKFRDVLNLSTGAVVELGRQTSEPVDILVNGALLASGEVVVIDDHFAVRITKLLDRVERLKRVL